MEKMKYQDKVKFVEKSIMMLQEENSREDIEDYLKSEGLKRWDIDKINQSIDNHLRHEYKAKIKSYMLENSLESKLSEFDDVDADLFEKIQYEIISEIEYESKRKVQKMLSQGKDNDEIIKTLGNPFFDQEAILETINLEVDKKLQKKNQNFKGIGFIIIGVVLTIGSINVFPGGIVLFYGAILYGIIILVRNKWDI